MRPLTQQQRDEFLDKAAMMAMQGILANAGTDYKKGELIFQQCYASAQALLAEREWKSK